MIRLAALLIFLAIIASMIACEYTSARRAAEARARGRAAAEAEMQAAGGARAWCQASVNAWRIQNGKEPCYED